MTKTKTSKTQNDCDANYALPRFVKGLQGMEVIGIAAGSNFSMCIIRGGALYSWGDNSLGQVT
jgi:alpha-tubulin suppressor-like RCC1 family protein